MPLYLAFNLHQFSTFHMVMNYCPKSCHRAALQDQEYKFRLHEHSEYGWSPRLRARDFISLLSNLTAIKIRATYSTEGKIAPPTITLRRTRLEHFSPSNTYKELYREAYQNNRDITLFKVFMT